MGNLFLAILLTLPAGYAIGRGLRRGPRRQYLEKSSPTPTPIAERLEEPGRPLIASVLDTPDADVCDLESTSSRAKSPEDFRAPLSIEHAPLESSPVSAVG